MTSLVCDLGGTNSRVGLAVDGRLMPATLASYVNDDFADFPSVLATHIEQSDSPRIDSVCVAMAAAPSSEGARLTNRDWEIRRADVSRVCGTDAIQFINDFEALGFALVHVDRLESRTLHSGTTSDCSGARLVLGAGTGFNAAACFPSRTGSAPHISAAECGHMTLPVEGADELSLQSALAQGRTRASNERALSGRGLYEIYQWCCARKGRPAEWSRPEDVAGQAVAEADPDCREAADIFLRLLGRVTGDLALAFLPHGGIYLSGGVTRALAPVIEKTPTFLAAFHAKGRQSSFMKTFSVSLLLDDRAALSGCVERLNWKA